MSALRETTPIVGPGNGSQSGPGRPQRRRPTAARPVGAAGQARRSAQQNLARREANLRISRRVSGPAAGVTRAAIAGAPVADLPDFIAGRGPASDVHLPGWDDPLPEPAAAPQARANAAPPARAEQPQNRPVQGRPAQPQGRAPQPQRRMAPPQRPQGTAPQGRRMSGPSPQNQAQRGAILVPATVGSAVPVGGASAAALPASSPQRSGLPLKTLTRPLFKLLPGGAPDASPRRLPRVTNAAVFVSAITLLVVTVGLIVALQIRVTQVNEQMGTELGQISALQASNIAQREANSALASNTKVAGFAHGRLVQPDVEDVTFRSAGNRSEMATRAATALRKLPVNPIGGIAAAKVATNADGTTAPTAATTPITAAATDASATPSGTGTSIDTTVDQATAATGTTATPQTGAGVTP
jgi:hypothetical protein